MLRALTPIGHCSAKLRRKLEIEETIALSWQIKIRKPNNEESVTSDGKGGRWHSTPNFAVPGPFWHRPISADGHVSFHYAWTTVSKSSSGKSVVADSRGKVSETDRTPGHHDTYVSREGAVMTICPAEFDRYAAREGVTDLSTGKPDVALLSNISMIPAVRTSFWDAVHATARKAGPDRLVLDPTRGTKKEWSALAAAEIVPTYLRQVAAQFATGDRQRKAEFPMTEAEAKNTTELICRFIPRADRKKGPVRFARGRKGRTQYRLEMELPAGLDDVARVRIMVRVAEEVEATKAMYTVALHEPDEHNDSRNYHLHVVAHDRPAKLINGQWDFAIATPVEGQSGRLTFSARKKKVVVERLTTASNRGDFEAFLRDLPSRYADICNEELRNAGQTRLFDPRRYAEMGIDREPTKALGSRLAPLEAAGVPTKVGIANAEIIWTYELQTRLRRCDADRVQRDQMIADLRADIDRQTLPGFDYQPAQSALDRAVQAAAFLAVVEKELAEYDVMLAMARARPLKAIDTCSRILEQVESGRGSSTDRRHRSQIKDRLDAATTFLQDIERIDRANQKVIAEQRPAIDEARRDIAAARDLTGNLKPQEFLAAKPVPMPPVTPAPTVTLDSPVTIKAPDAGAETPTIDAQRRPPETTAVTPNAAPVLEAIIARITEDRLVVFGPQHNGGEGYRVGGVTREELRVLRDPNLFGRAQTELARVARHQAEEIKHSYHFYQSDPLEPEDQLAAGGTDRPTPLSNPIGVLMAYRGHPLAANLMGWDVAEPQLESGMSPSVWRRMREPVLDVMPQPEAQLRDVPINVDPAVEAERELSVPGDGGSEPLDLPAVRTGSIQNSEGRALHFEALHKQANAKYERDRDEAISAWFAAYREEHRGALPVRFEGDAVKLDLDKLPDGLRRTADFFEDRILPAMEKELQGLRGELQTVFETTPELVRSQSGRIAYRPDDFPTGLRPHLALLFNSDPVVHGYAKAALRAQAPAATPAVPAATPMEVQKATAVTATAARPELSAEHIPAAMQAPPSSPRGLSAAQRLWLQSRGGAGR